MALSASSSAADSTLKQRMPAASAASISSAGLADSREHDLRRIAAGGDHPCELASGNDIEAASEAREDVQYSEVRIGLDGIAHEMGNARERVVECAEPALECSARVDVARRAKALGDRRQRHAFGVELAADDGERRHGRAAGGCGTASAGVSCAGAAGDSGALLPAAGAGGSFSGPFDAARRQRRDRDRACDDDVANPGDEIT
jgi:hypothetical protein